MLRPSKPGCGHSLTASFVNGLIEIYSQYVCSFGPGVLYCVEIPQEPNNLFVFTLENNLLSINTLFLGLLNEKVNLFYCFYEHSLYSSTFLSIDVGLGIGTCIFFLSFFILKIKEMTGSREIRAKVTHILQRYHNNCQKGMDMIKHNLVNMQKTATGVAISVECQRYLIYSYLHFSSAMVHNDEPFGKYHSIYKGTRVTNSVRITTVT